jgi:hypothetical protein
MRWLRRMFAPRRSAAPPSVTQADHEALDQMKAKQERILDRADKAIRIGMEEAGRVFAPAPYRGTERRKRPR